MAQEKLRDLHIAIADHNTTIVKQWIDSGHNLDNILHNGWSPLHSAAWYGKIETVAMLIKNNCNIDQTNLAQKTPLHLAVGHNNWQVIKILLNAQANPNITDERRQTSLHVAAHFSCIYIARLLIEHPCDTSIKDFEGKRALEILWNKNTLESIDKFTEYSDRPSMEILCKASLLEGITTPLQPYINLLIAQPHSALLSVLQNQRDSLDIFVKQDNINKQDTLGATLLMYAGILGHYDIITLLLSRGADLLLKTKNNKTVIDMVISMLKTQQTNPQEHFIKTVKVLLRHVYQHSITPLLLSYKRLGLTLPTEIIIHYFIPLCLGTHIYNTDLIQTIHFFKSQTSLPSSFPT